MSHKINTIPITNFEQKINHNRSQFIPPDTKPQSSSQFIFQLQPQIPELPVCPQCRTKQQVIRFGLRKSKHKDVQRYKCRKCLKSFSAEPLRFATYPPEIVISAISKYNLGATVTQTKKFIYRKFKTKVPKSTVQSWLKRYEKICTFTSTLRKHFDIDPNTIIRSKKFYHQQLYEFKFHTLKVNITGKSLPHLKSYLTSIYKIPYFIPNSAFQTGPRCSQTRINIKPEKISKNYNASRLAALAQTLATSNYERHAKVEDFFLINENTTLAIEIPVYIYPNEITNQEQSKYNLYLKKPLSGHIDILQERYNKIHILDYKPDAKRNDNGATDQLFLYALSLSKRTKLPLDKFVCAYFDDKNYFQFTLENL
jgi:transposase-like protein